MGGFNSFREITVGVVAILTLIVSPAYSHEENLGDEFNQLKDELKLIRRDIATMQQVLTEIHRKQVVPVPHAAADAKEAPTDILVTEYDHVFGNADASVVMIEYSEFQCPYCARFNKQTLGTIKQDFIDTGKIAYIPREFPLDFHKQARSASTFALCANEQGKYWTAREKLFEHQRELGEELYQNLVAEIELDPASFENCRSGIEVSKGIDLAMENGRSLGVRGTPTIFIGKMKDGVVTDARRVVGAQPVGVFRDSINSLLSN